MASEEPLSLAHQRCSSIIKDTHQRLRDQSHQVGAAEAWKLHMKDEEALKTYAKSMKELAEKHWKHNTTSEDRISWTTDFCEKYFQPDEIERWKQKDLKMIDLLKTEGRNIEESSESSSEPLTLDGKLETLDVGSSGNFFRDCERLKVLPIDISPSNDSVYFCDFLSVPITCKLLEKNRNIEGLPSNHFSVVIFCLLLEYLPSSEMRIDCCSKAYETLRTEGVLIIITPDSNHEMKNSKQIKNWRWTLANIGFQRVKIEKLSNLTCMSFRKSLHRGIPQRWAEYHKEKYMEFKLEIPQDKKKSLKLDTEKKHDNRHEFDLNIMNELPIE